MPKIFTGAQTKREAEASLYSADCSVSWLRFGVDRDGRTSRAADRRDGRLRWSAWRFRLLVRRPHRRNTLNQRDDLVARQRLVFQQAARERVQIVQTCREDLLRLLVGGIHDASDFRVD